MWWVNQPNVSLRFHHLLAEPVMLVQIQLLEFNPETDSIKVLASYLHGQEVWHLAPHPQNAQILATIRNQGQFHLKSPPCHEQPSSLFNSSLL